MFGVAFDDFIKTEYGSYSSAKSTLEDMISYFDDKAEELIVKANLADALLEAGAAIAYDIYSGGLPSDIRWKIAKSIGMDFFLSTVRDIITYHGISSGTLEGKIVAELVQVAASHYLARYSIPDKKAALVEDTRLGFYAQLALAKRLAMQAINNLERLSNGEVLDVGEMQETFYAMSEAMARGYGAIAGWAYLEDENFSDKVSQAIGTIVGSYIMKEVEKSSGGNDIFSVLKTIAEVSDFVDKVTDSPDRRIKEIKRLFEESYIGEALKKMQREASRQYGKFGSVLRYVGY